MLGYNYQLTSPTLAIVIQADETRIPITVPNGAIITVIAGPLDGHRLVEVRWEKKTVLMFTSDIRKCGTPVRNTGTEGV